MTDHNDETLSRRLKILGKEEIRNIFELPDLTIEERLEYFSFSKQERDFLDRLRFVPSKLYFILQAGYFKARLMFFNFEFANVPEDVEYILQTHFHDQDVDLESLRAVAKNTRLNGQRVLLKLYRYRRCGKKERRTIEEKTRALEYFRTIEYNLYCIHVFN